MNRLVENGTYIAEDLTRAVIGAAIEVHNGLGPGLLESAYEVCLCDEFIRRDISFQRQLELPVIYKGRRLDCGYRIDLLVADKLIVELKAVEEIAAIYEAQLLTYMRLSHKRVGLIINFNVARLKDGIVRRVL